MVSIGPYSGRARAFFARQPPPPLVKLVVEERPGTRQSHRSAVSLSGAAKRQAQLRRKQPSRVDASSAWSVSDSGLEVCSSRIRDSRYVCFTAVVARGLVIPELAKVISISEPENRKNSYENRPGSYVRP